VLEDRDEDLIQAMGFAAADQEPPEEVRGATWAALRDLELLGAVELSGPHWIKDTDLTRQIRRGASLRDAWPQIAAIDLDPEHLEFLSAAVELSERQAERWASTHELTVDEVLDALSWAREAHDYWKIAHELAEAACLRVQGYGGGAIDLVPTYIGVVRATEAAEAAWIAEVAELIKEGENTNVDLKRELELKTKAQKAELVKDVLALANTKSPGSKRYLIVGVDDDGRFFADANPKVSKDTLEDVLGHYARPVPDIRYRTVETPGRIGIVEIMRDPAKVPYRVNEPIEKLTKGDVFVRHGSHVAKADAEELADLVAEGMRVRGE
jgi:hypothetical protein